MNQLNGIKMKKLFLGLLVLGSLSSFASDNYTSIICETASGALSGYHGQGSKWALNTGCNPSDTCAANKLKATLSEIPDVNIAAYSDFFEDYVEVKKKNVARVTIDTTVSVMTGRNCTEKAGGYENVLVDCSQSTACVSVNISYDKCTKVAYDSRTGAETVTCPSGKVIK
jgi:hypothetical protein